MSQSQRGTGMRDSHRMFVQGFMSRSVLNGSEVYALLKDCCDRFEDGLEEEEKTQMLIDFCKLINDSIRPFSMEIKKGIDEQDGKSYFGLVNTVEDNITRCASQYTENELDFFKQLLEELAKSASGTIGSISAINIADRLGKKMTKNDADHLLERLEHDRWIGKTNRGEVYLGIRGLMEMDQYMFEMFEGYVVRCNLCKKLCLQGLKCETCSAKLHKHCANKFFKQKTGRQCPQCREPWQDGPGQSQDPDTMETSQSQTTERTSRKRKSYT